MSDVLYALTDKIVDLIKQSSKLYGYIIGTVLVLMCCWVVAFYLFQKPFLENNIIIILTFSFVFSFATLIGYISVAFIYLSFYNKQRNEIMFRASHVILGGCGMSIVVMHILVPLHYIAEYEFSRATFGNHVKFLPLTLFIESLAVGAIGACVVGFVSNAVEYAINRRKNKIGKKTPDEHNLNE